MKTFARPQGVALVTLLCGVAATLLAWYLVGSEAEKSGRSQFKARAELATNVVERRIQRYIDVLYGLDAYVTHHGALNRAGFHDYVRALDLGGRFPAVQAVEFIRRVPHEQREAFVREVRGDRTMKGAGYPQFDIHPAGARPEYWVIDLVEPMENNLTAFGLDIRTRMAVSAAERARDSGEPEMTGRYRLAQEIGESFGLVVYQPVYALPEPLSETARRDALRGFVNVVLRVEDMLAGLLEAEGLEGLQAEFHDLGTVGGTLQPVSEETRFYGSGPPALQPPWYRHSPRVSQDLRIGGRHWRLVFEAQPRVWGWMQPMALVVLGSGLATSLLLFVFLRASTRTRSEAVALAKEATRELRNQLAFSRQLIEAIPNPVFFKDRQGRYIGCNQAFEQYTGRGREALIGRTALEVMPGDIAEVSSQADRRLLQAPGEHSYELNVAFGGEGERRDVIVNKATFLGEDGTIAGLVGVVVDITQRKQLEASMRESNERLRAVIQAAPLAIISRDRDRVIRMWNPSAERMFGWKESEVLGTRTSILPAHLVDETDGLRARVEGGETIWLEETQRLARDGRVLDVSMTMAPVYGADGAIDGTMVTIADISPRKRAEAALRESEAQLRLAMDAAQLGMWDWEASEDRFNYSEGLGRLFGRHPGDPAVDYQTLQTMLHPEDRELFRASIRHAVKHGTDFQVDYRVVWPDGSAHWISNRGQVLRDAEGRAARVIGVAMEITERKMAEQRIAHMAHHDALTGLPNRALLRDRIQQAIAQANRHGKQMAVLFIDLDRFKTINDSLGHEFGDRLLQAVASRILVCVREGDTVSRVGGDEFVIVVPSVSDAAHASVVATKILEVLGSRFHLHGNDLHVQASIGISLYPSDGQDAETLMRNADTAMYHAKDSGRGNYQFFTQHMNVAAQQRLAMENALRRSLEREEFELHYQPVFDLRDRTVLGFEALLRWSPEWGPAASPGDFIAAAEESGLIVPIGDWVLREALRQAKGWQSPGHPVRMAINVSARQLARHNFVERLQRLVEEIDIDPRLVELEVTEGVIIEGAGEARAALDEIAALGVSIAIDDFGTGYSGLAYLKRLPIDTVKIDQSFVRDLTIDPDDAAIVTAIVAMSRSLGLDVVAEGIETEEQLQELVRLGCRRGQGYLLARPMPAGAVRALLGREAAATADT